MVLELLPPVALVAPHSLAAPAHLEGLEVLGLVPVGALLGLVAVLAGRPPEVLDVVGVHAVLAVVAEWRMAYWLV